ncbi:hypothetical protein BV22DRAFT_1135940 [Leucogyrophana mollusca]|uniref:Uncharacterized protein n=1 Tax=Leucogyrophana mollusca TaxID=85980 RepID=A0ACB8AVR3_9AGAM|nr:hypothetical protein BV22DRAFT_1135940 [Leucogyrophana mollusca]
MRASAEPPVPDIRKLARKAQPKHDAAMPPRAPTKGPKSTISSTYTPIKTTWRLDALPNTPSPRLPSHNYRLASPPASSLRDASISSRLALHASQNRLVPALTGPSVQSNTPSYRTPTRPARPRNSSRRPS